MIPDRYGEYRLFFEAKGGILFLQLLVNVPFGALAGAVVANLSKRALYEIGAFIVAVAVGLGMLVMLVLWVSAVETCSV